MKTFRPQGYETLRTELEGWPVNVASYQLGEVWACKIDNVSPGAVIARGEGDTREDAVADATSRAVIRLRTTRRLEVLADEARALAEELKRM